MIRMGITVTSNTRKSQSRKRISSSEPKTATKPSARSTEMETAQGLRLEAVEDAGVAAAEEAINHVGEMPTGSKQLLSDQKMF